MLNPFPELLSFSFFAPTLLRAAAAVALGYSAYVLIQERKKIHTLRLPLIGTPSVSLVWVSSGITALVAASLLFGYGTQIATALGAVIALKYSFIPKRLEQILPLSRETYWIVAVICISLLATGAGGFAMDLPL